MSWAEIITLFRQHYPDTWKDRITFKHYRESQMSYISELKRFYPKSYKARLAIQRYDSHKEWEHEAPTTITIHETTLNYGGPEEGGWWYYAGLPVLTHCIFSKKQAIQAFIQYFDEYEIADQPSLGDSTTYHNYEVNFANDFAKAYPEQRPHYC